MHKKPHILLYDGHCVMCNYAVRKVLKWDKENAFRISPLEGGKGKELLEQYQIPSSIDSIILITDGNVKYRSEAFGFILKELRPYHLFRLFLWALPMKWADVVYRWIAKNRYRWFGRYDVCPVLPKEYKNKML